MSFTISVVTASGSFAVQAERGEILADVLSRTGVQVAASCGRRGVCSKCLVRLCDGSFDGVTPDENSMIKSCRARVCRDACVSVDFSLYAKDCPVNIDGISRGSCVCAVDVGTTTLAAALLTADGRIFTRSALNPQSSFGADVISRITACADGHLGEMKSLVMQSIDNMVRELSIHGKPERIVICGNSAMIHILCGESPEGMGRAPFTPAFTCPKRLGTIADCDDVTTLPATSAFIGSDIVAGIYANSLHSCSGTVLLADLGTNGELVLAHNGSLYCASTAVGPALEGAGIECGVGGVEGAISRVEISGFGIDLSTVGRKEPCGICGSGLVDSIAGMLDMGIVDSTGFMEDERYYLTKSIYISREDVRAFQLAKSAVRSGIEVLCGASGITCGDVEGVLLAGGTGWWLNRKNAVKTGLLPFDENKISAVGNSALNGALMAACSPDCVQEAEKIAKMCKIIDLGGNAEFAQKFMENMNFGVQK